MSEGSYAVSSLDELGDNFGFRKVRKALGVTAFGANFVVYPPNFRGPEHYHDLQDELYFVHSGRARLEVGGEAHEVGPGGIFHVESTTPRRVTNITDEPLVMLVVGGKGGYVERDGHVMSEEDMQIRQGLGTSDKGAS